MGLTLNVLYNNLQVSIDSAKRAFDVDVGAEIKRLKKELNVEEIGYPLFWFMLKRKNRFAKTKTDDTPEKRKKMKNLNKSLVCPMNHVCEMSFFPERRFKEQTFPMDYFFNHYPVKSERRASKKLETFIEKYCADLTYKIDGQEEMDDKNEEKVFEEMLEELKQCYIPDYAIGVVSNLLDRAFQISPKMKASQGKLKSNLWRNKPLLFKILYTINKSCLLNCLNKNIY